MGLRTLRKEKGFTQVQLAQMVHVDQTASASGNEALRILG